MRVLDERLEPAQFVGKATNTNVVRPACFGRAVQVQPVAISETERLTLDRLRWLAIRASLHGREDMDQACALLVGDANQSFERFGEMFFRGLAMHSRHRLRFHRPRATEMTDDEIWLLRLLRMYAQNDSAQAARMIAWHIPKGEQRWMRFLAEGIARRVQ
ncbi:MAG: hypothetical protein AAF141_05530 [Pseudomonadota bacterium]